MSAGTDRTAFALPRPGVLGAVALALATGFGAWLVLGRGGEAPAPTTAATSTAAAVDAIGPVALTASGLRARVSAFDQPVYWLGPEPSHRYELKRTGDGSVFLRYLPAGAQAGDPALFRTVGTYPFPGAYASMRQLAGEEGTVWFSVNGGGVGVYRRSRPTNVYLAWPGLDYQVEVYDPNPAAARRLAESAALRRLG